MYEHGVHLGYSFGFYVILLLPFYISGYILYPFASSEQHDGNYFLNIISLFLLNIYIISSGICSH